MQNRLKWDRRMNMGAQNLNVGHQTCGDKCKKRVWIREEILP